MSKVVILAINARYVHSCLAAWLLAEGVAQFARLPHDVTVVETNINQTDEEIISVIANMTHNPLCNTDVIAIPTYIWNATKLPNLIKKLRELMPKAIFVLGGPEAAHNTDYWLDHGADYIISGVGERKFAELLDTLAGATLRHNTALTYDFIDPFTDTYLAALTGKIAYIETSRGCPFRCAFCLSGTDTVRFFPMDAVKKQLDKLARADVRIVKFVDRTFNADARRAYDIIDYILRLDTPNRFHFEVAADLFDQRTLELLATAPLGKIQIEAGLQSFFAPTLEAITRKTNLDKAVKNIQTILRVGNIHVHVDLIAGLPHETLTDFMDSFDAAYAIGAHTLQLGFLKMLHGSELRNNEKSIMFNEEPPYEIISSPWLGETDLEILRRTEDALQNTYNKGRFLRTLQYVLKTTNIRPFMLYRQLGEAVPKNSMPLEIYAEKIYDFCLKLPGIKPNALIDQMILDWMEMVKGVNMPRFMKLADKRKLAETIKTAEVALGRKIRRNEAAQLTCGKDVYVDSENRDLVTGLYKIVF